MMMIPQSVVMNRWYWFVSKRLVHLGVTALLLTIGGPTFVRKLGLPNPPYGMVQLLLALARLRAFALGFFPMRTQYHGHPITSNPSLC